MNVFRSKVRPRTFECVAMGSTVLFILRSRLLLYSADMDMVDLHLHRIPSHMPTIVNSIGTKVCN